MSVRTLRHRALAASIALGALVASCGGSDSSVEAETPWGQEAVGLFDAFTHDLTVADRYAAAGHFSTGGVLDLRAWGGEANSGRLAIAEALGKILYITPRAALDGTTDHPDLVVHVDQVFLGDLTAIVRFDAQFRSGGVPWMQLFALDAHGAASSRLYTEDLGHVVPGARWTHEPEHEFYDRYVDVWSSGDPDRLAEVYATTVVVRDAFGQQTRVGLESLSDEIESRPEIEHGPWPELFRYDVDGRHEQVAVFQLGGSCPALEARRWVFDDGVIVDETRYAHVASVRRCEGSGPEGWWTGFDPATTDEFAKASIDVGGRTIDVVNADERQVDLVRWLLGRYDAGGLELPDVAAAWFPPSVDCGLSEALATPADARFDHGHTVTLCFTPDEVSAGWPDGGPPAHVAHQGLHELAHVWMYDHLDDQDRSAFLRRVGLDTWRDASVFWPERGVELAAETIAWGLAGAGDAEYLVRPQPDCDELTERFVLLTGRGPLTTCVGGG